MSSHEQELARLRAEADQAVAGIGEFARAVAKFNASLQQHGFNERQAMELTAAWITAMAASVRDE